MSNASMPLGILGATYPIELYNDAKALRDRARASKGRTHDNSPVPEERVYSRAAIFGAFNFLESLLIELAQDYITAGPGVAHSSRSCASSRQAAIRSSPRADQERSASTFPGRN